jgi:hypothetical protein
LLHPDNLAQKAEVNQKVLPDLARRHWAVCLAGTVPFKDEKWKVMNEIQ